jgi:hypothetical protein
VNQHIQYVQRALSILEVQYSEKDNLDSLLIKLKNIIVLPASETEFNMQQLCLKIAQSIETQQGDVEILVLLDKLVSEATYNLLD